MIAACLKWVDQRPEADALGLPAEPDARFGGVSAADQAALEWALRCSGPGGDDVLAISVGPSQADGVLRDALAAGATRAVRIDVPFGAPSRVVAACLAAHLGGASLVWCGDASFDRGTGSVPAFLADELGYPQALGLVAVDLASGAAADGVRLDVLRRLDGGRRERLAISGPTVLSVEGSTAMLRRAPLRALLGRHGIEVACPTAVAIGETSGAGVSRPYRPRPRALAPPSGETALDRVKELLAPVASGARGELVVLPPAEAAERILSALRDWGYLP